MDPIESLDGMMTITVLRPCRFGKKCKNRDCPNAHLEGNSGMAVTQYSVDAA